MRKRYHLDSGWEICRADEMNAFEQAELLSARVQQTQCTQDEIVWYSSAYPTSVQDILCRCGVLPEKAGDGCEDLRWVAEKSWIYRRTFRVEEPENVHAQLHFLGVDTVADFFMNGEHIGNHTSMYLRAGFDVSSLLKRENTLTILFHSPVKEIEKRAAVMPEEWKGVIDPPRLLRKALADSGTFLGNVWPCACVGLYDEVYLDITPGDGRLTSFEAGYELSWNLKKGLLDLSAEAEGNGAQRVRFTVFNPEGEIAGMNETEIVSGRASCTIALENPLLWWPQPYGPQNLYRIEARLLCGDDCLDRSEKRIGLRLTQYEGDFRFRINHTRIRLWGSNFVNVDGMTHWCDRERLETLVSYAQEGHFNIFRIWGEAPMLPDLFYELCDEKGILVWQDFGLGFGPWPDSQAYQDIFREEVSQMVSRLKDHPSLLLWCGSNETYMTAESRPLRDGGQYGMDLIFRVAAQVCRQLDPKRLYIPSSPMGGDYPQDASGGDMHGYWGNDFEPGILYPVLFSESCHATTYCGSSMRRFMSEEEIWPDGWADNHVHDPAFIVTAEEKGRRREHSYALTFQNSWRQVSVPPTWRKHLSEFAPSELWDLEDYFDAHDANSILYKYAVCGADFYKREIERIRRGRPCDRPFERRGCSGYITWKYNDAWPHINFTQIDYYLEPTAQYYALKRGFAPVLAGVSAEADHLYLWAVNDSTQTAEGVIRLRIFSRLCNRIEQEYTFPVRLRPDESRTVDCLDWLGPMPREWILHTSFEGNAGEDFGSNICYLDKERKLAFPKPVLSLSRSDGCIEIRTDKYARYVELTGVSEDGEISGWRFSDNYFDLLPFETKRIRIGGKYKSGVIRAKAFYGEETAELSLQ